MQRQHRPSRRHSRPSLEGVLAQHGTGPYCVKCQRFISSKDAVSTGRGRLRCPACGELLERRRQGEQATDGTCQNGTPADPA
jgi:hypothetical protein